MKYRIEVKWNRNFHYSPFSGPINNKKTASYICEELKNSGDGARIKDARIINDLGEVIYAYGKFIK